MVTAHSESASISKPILVAYATRDGQSERVARYLCEQFDTLGRSSALVSARDHVVVSDYSAAVLVASVHLGKHEREMIAFAKRYHEALAQIPSAFLSLSMSEAVVEGMGRIEDQRAEAALDVRTFVTEFLRETEWHPLRIKPVAGAIRYSQHGWIVRTLIRRIAESKDLPTDTSHDYDFTNYADLEHFARDFCAVVDWASTPTSAANAPSAVGSQAS